MKDSLTKKKNGCESRQDFQIPRDESQPNDGSVAVSELLNLHCGERVEQINRKHVSKNE